MDPLDPAAYLDLLDLPANVESEVCEDLLVEWELREVVDLLEAAVYPEPMDLLDPRVSNCLQYFFLLSEKKH